MELQSQVRYGILLPDGKLARYEKYYSNCCDQYIYKLSDDPRNPEWLVENPDDVAKTIFTDVSWYNSSYCNPCWGKFQKHQLKPAKVIIQVVIEPTDEVKILTNIDALDVRSLPWNVAKIYSGNPNLPKDKRYISVLTELSVEEVKQHSGEKVYFNENIYYPRVIVTVIPVPETYPYQPTGKNPQSVLICETVD